MYLNIMYSVPCTFVCGCNVAVSFLAGAMKRGLLVTLVLLALLGLGSAQMWPSGAEELVALEVETAK